MIRPLRSTAAAHTLATSVLAGLIGSCRSSATGDIDSARPSDHESAPVLSFSLPPGVAVELDGVALGTTPLQPRAVEPGPHELRLVSRCEQTATRTVHADGGGIIEVGPEEDFARLRLTIVDPIGSLLPYTAWLDDVELPSEELVHIHGCPAQLRVATQGRGAFREALVPEPGEVIARTIVLRPGSDLIRVPGGRFIMGPPLHKLFRYGSQERVHVDVATFDMDAAEVTTSQFMQCVADGACVIESRNVFRGDRTWGAYCTLEFSGNEARPKEGYEHHPVNCIAAELGEAYCAWAGKRLPTEIEWEYAASNRGRHVFPWGDDPDCDDSSISDARCERRSHVGPVCAFEPEISELGFCDMASNVREFVSAVRVPGRFDASTYRGGDWRRPEPAFVGSTGYALSAEYGFRCAASVEGADPAGRR